MLNGRALTCTRCATATTKKLRKEIERVVEFASSALGLAFETFFAELIVRRPLFRVRQNLVSLAHLNEEALSIRIPGIFVGVIFFAQSLVVSIVFERPMRTRYDRLISRSLALRGTPRTAYGSRATATMARASSRSPARSAGARTAPVRGMRATSTRVGDLCGAIDYPSIVRQNAAPSIIYRSLHRIRSIIRR